MKNNPISRLWFMSQGYRKHPRFNLWGHEGCSYFLNACGRKVVHTYGPAMRAKSKGRGYRGPVIRQFTKACHVLMGEIFYGERPILQDSKGKPYFGVCHHLIEDPLNYAPENLLCWLDYSTHRKADNRRRALEAIVPDGDLHCIPYARLRYLQDPRTLSDEDFQKEIEYLREELEKHPLVKCNPLDAAWEERRKYA